MVPISIDYKSDFHLKDDFLKSFLSSTPQIKIVLESRQEELGEVIIFHFNDFTFEVPTFVAAHYSYHKIEARFIAQLYRYIKSMK